MFSAHRAVFLCIACFATVGCASTMTLRSTERRPALLTPGRNVLPPGFSEVRDCGAVRDAFVADRCDVLRTRPSVVLIAFDEAARAWIFVSLGRGEVKGAYLQATRLHAFLDLAGAPPADPLRVAATGGYWKARHNEYRLEIAGAQVVRRVYFLWLGPDHAVVTISRLGGQVGGELRSEAAFVQGLLAALHDEHHEGRAVTGTPGSSRVEYRLDASVLPALGLVEDQSSPLFDNAFSLGLRLDLALSEPPSTLAYGPYIEALTASTFGDLFLGAGGSLLIQSGPAAVSFSAGGYGRYSQAWSWEPGLTAGVFVGMRDSDLGPTGLRFDGRVGLGDAKEIVITLGLQVDLVRLGYLVLWPILLLMGVGPGGLGGT